MEDDGIFLDTWSILRSFYSLWTLGVDHGNLEKFPVLVFFNKKNLATLVSMTRSG
jgi:hypothetical protein